MISAYIIIIIVALGFILFSIPALTTGAATIMTTPKGPLDISNQQKTGIGQLTYSDVVDLASAAGFAGDDLVMMVAVCFAESYGNPDSLNSNGSVAPAEGSATDVFSVGLWQINLNVHREYQSVNLFDPATNANAAKTVFDSQGLRAWGGYTSGNYKKYLTGASEAVNA